MALKGQYIHTSKDQGTITALKKKISFWEGVVALKGQYI